tara:strand:+ start:358 stop:528 length:171 start_codon:yes stop_codon:yes gene_type:complete
MPITIQCGLCKNYLKDLKCKAFPKGIPQEILEGQDHTEPFKGDNGIQFEPIEDTNA